MSEANDKPDEGEEIIGTEEAAQPRTETMVNPDGDPLLGDLRIEGTAIERFNGSEWVSLTDEQLLDMADEMFGPPAGSEPMQNYLHTVSNLVTTAQFESGSLLGDMVKLIVSLFKDRPKNWSQMSELEQRDMGKAITEKCKTILKRVAMVIAEEDEISIAATLKGYSAKPGEFDLKLSAVSDSETATQLFNLNGHDVLIISADAERFFGSGPEIETDPDNFSLPFDAETGPDYTQPSEPENPLIGQSWRISENDDVKLFHGKKEGWKAEPLPETPDEPETEDGDELPKFNYNQDTQPKFPAHGERWFNPTNEETRVYKGPSDGWILLEPETVKAEEPEAAEGDDLEASETAETGEDAEPEGDDLNDEPRVNPDDYDHFGKQPDDPKVGESWYNPATDKVKYWHGTGFYVNPPKAEKIAEANDGGGFLSGDEGFPDGPDDE